MKKGGVLSHLFPRIIFSSPPVIIVTLNDYCVTMVVTFEERLCACMLYLSSGWDTVASERGGRGEQTRCHGYTSRSSLDAAATSSSWFLVEAVDTMAVRGNATGRAACIQDNTGMGGDEGNGL